MKKKIFVLWLLGVVAFSSCKKDGKEIQKPLRGVKAINLDITIW